MLPVNTGKGIYKTFKIIFILLSIIIVFYKLNINHNSESFLYKTSIAIKDFTDFEKDLISIEEPNIEITEKKNQKINNLQTITTHINFDISSEQYFTIKARNTTASNQLKLHYRMNNVDHNKKNFYKNTKDLIKPLIIPYLNSPKQPIIIKTQGTYLQRIKQFSDEISELRLKILEQNNYTKWIDFESPKNLQVVWGRDDDYLKKLSKFKHISIVILPWNVTLPSWNYWTSNEDNSNVLIKNYYKWIASDNLCNLIKSPHILKAHYDAVFNRSCEVNIEISLPANSLEFMYYHSKPINTRHYWPNIGTAYPSYFYQRPPLDIFSLSIIPNAIVNLVGDVISRNLKFVPFSCSDDILPTVPIEYPNAPIYKEVFVLTQFWGEHYFHKMLEVLPRIVGFLDFLKKNENIVVHLPNAKGQYSTFLKILGINPQRIITGIVRAKIAYVPKSTPCGFPNVHNIQLLSRLFKRYIRKHFDKSELIKKKNSLILIRRSNLRRFLHQDKIEYRLKKIASDFNYTFVTFSDNPTPDIGKTMELFYSAKIVVAPHGAGLANLLYSRAGILVLEGVCNPPHVNLCFQFTAHMLGMRYHALMSGSGCEKHVNVRAELVEATLLNYIQLFKNYNIK